MTEQQITQMVMQAVSTAMASQVVEPKPLAFPLKKTIASDVTTGSAETANTKMTKTQAKAIYDASVKSAKATGTEWEKVREAFVKQTGLLDYANGSSFVNDAYVPSLTIKDVEPTLLTRVRKYSGYIIKANRMGVDFRTLSSNACKMAIAGTAEVTEKSADKKMVSALNMVVSLIPKCSVTMRTTVLTSVSKAVGECS